MIPCTCSLLPIIIIIMAWIMLYMLKKFRDDAKMVIMAGGAAQKAVDFILGRKVVEV